jgi:hypothetical protein
VYQGLTPEQDAKARSWSADTGLNAFQVESYRPSSGFSLPTWLAISLTGFGLLFTPLLALTLRSDVRALSGLAATLTSVGLARTWIRPVFRTLVGVTMLVVIVAAVLSAFVTISVFNSLYPTVFDVLGAPWWMLALFIGVLFAATQLAAQLAFRGLHKKEHVVTV